MIIYLATYFVGFAGMWLLSLRGDKRHDIEFNFFETFITASLWPFFAVVIPCIAIYTFLTQKFSAKNNTPAS
ncbi:oxidoreductase [Klebsiella sp. Ap-873]|nr:oxidoreductase [Klebsiella sp. Ap-873]